VERDFDMAISLRLTVDHGITLALQYVTPELDVPIVPLIINSFTQPLPTMRRCRALGEAVRQIIEKDGQSKRVAVVATGGISHDLPFFPKWYEAETEQEQYFVDAMFPRDDEGTKKWAEARGSVMKGHTPLVNEAFDEEVLRMVTERDWDAILALTDDHIDRFGGNGAHEIRSW